MSPCALHPCNPVGAGPGRDCAACDETEELEAELRTLRARPDPMVVAEAVRRTFRAAAEIVERPPSAIWTVQEAADLLRAHAKCGHPASDVVGDMCQRCGLTVPQALASLGTTPKGGG